MGMIDKQEAQKIAEAKQQWEKKSVEKTLAKAPERQKEFHTGSQPVERVYTPADIADTDYLKDIGFPGEYPYTRGVQPTMYRGRVWTMRQYAGFATPKESNERFKFLLSQGQTGLSVAFDLPTQLGYNSDDPRATGEVGKVGVAICSLRDMEQMFEGIPLDKVSTSMTINATAPILLALYVAVAEKQGVPLEKLNGTTQNDVLKEYAARGTYIFPPKHSLRLAGDLIHYTSQAVPKWNPISICGYHIREAGSNAAQEIAFTLADAIDYVEEVLRRGVPIDEFGPRLSFMFNTAMNLFEEVAKYRAVRRMWAKIARERFGATDPRAWMLRTHTQTGGSYLIAQQPENNIIRATVQCMAAVLGGVQSIALSCFDEAYALPTEDSQRIALRTQQVLAHETGIADSVDPLAGSFMVEKMTNELEKAAWDYLRKIEDMGGAVGALERGYIQHEVQQAAYAHLRAVEDGSQVVVGLNKFTEGESKPLALFRPDPAAERAQRESLAIVRGQRDNQKVKQSLGKLHEAAKQDTNLMPHIVEAVRSYTTIGEICDVLRSVFGEYRPASTM